MNKTNETQNKKKVGRPKKNRSVVLDDILTEDGDIINPNKGSKDAQAAIFKERIENPNSARNRGMYAGMADPESFIEFYKRTLANEHKAAPWQYPTPKALQDDITSYFTFCIDRRIAVTVAGLCSWLGITTGTLHNWQRYSDIMPLYEVVEPAIAFIHSMTEQGAIDGNIPVQAYMFVAKNYHSMTDKVEYFVTPQGIMDVKEQEEIVNRLPKMLKSDKKDEKSKELCHKSDNKDAET